MQNGVMEKIILKLLRVGASEKIEKILRNSNVAEIGSILSQLDSSQKKMLFSLLFQSKSASHTIRDFSPALLQELLKYIPNEWVLESIEKLHLDDVADLLDKVSEEQKKWLLEKLSQDKKDDIAKLLTYDKNSAGGIMNPHVFALSASETVTQAINQLRTQTKVEMVFYLYVIDDHKQLVGIISLRQLIMSKESSMLSDVMDKNIVSVNANMTQNEVAQKISRYNFLAVPVVDDDHHLLGVITVDDIIEVVQEESMLELYRMAGIEKDERVFTPVRSSIKKRAPWLIINLGTAVLAAQVVSLFEGTIEKVVLLATFLPIVASMGGNAGTQTVTVAIRGLSMGEMALRDVWRATKKEVLLGVSNGVITGAIMAVIAYFWKGIPMLGVVLMLAMIGNLFISGLVGVLVPVGLKALRIDPAVASTVIVTTFTDCFGFFSFLGLAALFIKYLI